MSSIYNYSIDEQEILNNFGLNFKHYLTKAKLTQDDIVEIIGFSKPYISNTELGKHNISLINALKIASIVNKTIEEMIKEI